MHYVSPRHAEVWRSRHIRYLAEKLMAVERGEIKRLMVFMPPRHFKSQTTSVHFATWFLGRNPDKYVVIASYGSTLAEGFSRQARNLMMEYGETLFEVRVSQKSSAVDHWEIEDRYGAFDAVGVGGGLTGKGASLLVIDDPHKDREEADSETMRKRVWEWYTSTAYTRLEPDGAIVLIQTRWHPDDLAGMLLKAMESDDGDKWEVISFPALAEDNDVLGRSPSEALWPERFNESKLHAIRTAIGSREFVSLYQQRPQALEGGAFKAEWLGWYTRDEVTYNDEKDCWYYRDQPLTIYQGIDLATTTKSYSDDFAIVTIGVTPTMLALVLDVVAGQFDPGQQGDIVSEAYLNWLPETVVIEDNNAQKYFVDVVKKWHLSHPGHPLIPVKAVTNSADKYARITRMVPFVENGGLLLRRCAEGENGWVDMDRLPYVKIHPKMRKLYEQLVTFAPDMTHDDVADALDLAVSVGARRGRFLDDWAKRVMASA